MEGLKKKKSKTGTPSQKLSALVEMTSASPPTSQAPSPLHAKIVYAGEDVTLSLALLGQRGSLTRKCF